MLTVGERVEIANCAGAAHLEAAENRRRSLRLRLRLLLLLLCASAVGWRLLRVSGLACDSRQRRRRLNTLARHFARLAFVDVRRRRRRCCASLSSLPHCGAQRADQRLRAREAAIANVEKLNKKKIVSLLRQ